MAVLPLLLLYALLLLLFYAYCHKHKKLPYRPTRDVSSVSGHASYIHAFSEKSKTPTNFTTSMQWL